MKLRSILLLLVAGGWFLVVGAKLYHLQVVQHEHFKEKAEDQQQRVVVLNPPRGTIYDARGRELAVSVEVESAYAVPIEIENGRKVRQIEPVATAAQIARALPGVDRRELAADLAQDRRFVWVERKLDPPVSRALRELELPGIAFIKESRRYYPLRELAAQVLGYVGTDNVGLAGLEAIYNRAIVGTPGRRTIVQDARRGKVLHPDFEVDAPHPGKDLHLTLDAAIQAVAERELLAAVAKHNAKSGSVVVMNPHTGAILAMASVPGFDPNRFTEFSKESWRNLAIMDAFEPGSTFKMVTFAAALEAGVVVPDDVFDCGMGSITVQGSLIRDHKPFGLLTAREVMAKSSNVGTIKIGLKAGTERFVTMLRAFGFGRETGIDLPAESPGQVRPQGRWNQLATAYGSFGQSLSVTPLQLAVAFGAIANGGKLVRPYVVESVGRGAEAKHHTPRGTVGLPVSPRVQRQIAIMLESVVSEGTAKTAQIPGYGVAGKTGTAQKIIGKAYSPNKHVASFVGYAPFQRPAVVCVVVIDEPWPAYHGGDVAAPVFAAVVGQVLLYLGMPPERDRPETWPGEPVPEAEQDALGGSQLADSELGTPELESAGPPSPPPPGTVPDLTGLSARQAIAGLSALGLAPELRGHGFVARQAPPPGTPLAAAGGKVELWLARGGA